MRKLVGLLALSTLLLSACACRQTVVSAPALTKDDVAVMKARTVRVAVECPDGEGWGSGVIMGPDRNGEEIVATASHVPHVGCELYVDGLPAQVVARDTWADVALLNVGVPTDLPPIEEAEPWLGMPVVAMGFPVQMYTDAGGFQVTRGYVAAQYGARWRVTASFWEGSSGGPTFDESGRLVGLNVSTMVLQDKPIDDQYIVIGASPVFLLYRLMESVGDAHSARDAGV